MPTANATLRDLLLARQSGIDRLSDREVRRLLPILSRTQRDVLRLLRQRLDVALRLGLDRGPMTTERLRLLLREAEALLVTAYRQIGEQLPERLSHLAQIEERATNAMLRKAVPSEISWSSPKVPGAILERLARQPIAEQTLSSYFASGRKSLVAQEVRRYSRAIRETIESGLLTGDPVEQMVRAIRARGVTVARNSLRFVVDSAVKQTVQAARLETFKANAGPDGVVKGYQWLSTIDLHTTPEWCIPRDLKLYDLDFQPIGHGVPWGAGPGAIHPRCRSTSIAVLKSWRELGLPFREVGRTTRASMDGRVPSTRSVADRLSSKRTTLGELERVFGKQRGRLVYGGDVSIADLYDRQGKYLPLKSVVQAAG